MTCNTSNTKAKLRTNESKYGHFCSCYSQIMVAGRYNASRSTTFSLVERVNVIGTATDYSGVPRMTSVRQDIVVRQRH